MKGKGIPKPAVSKADLEQTLTYPLDGFKKHLNKLDACFAIVNKNGKIFFANDAFYNCLDLKPTSEQAPEFSFFDLFTPKALSCIKNDVLPAITHYHLWSGKLELFDRQDKKIKTSIDCTWIKITKEKEELFACWIHLLPGNEKTNLHIPNENINVLYSLFEMCPSPIYIHDKEGRFLMINEAGAKSSGYTQKELLSKTVMDLDESATQKEVIKLYKSLECKNHITMTSTQKRKDGTTFPIEVFVCNIKLDGQRQMLSYVHDISLREQYQNEFQRNDKVRKLLVGITSYFAVVDLKDFDTAVQKALRDLAKFSGVNRCYLFKFDDKNEFMYNTYEWCSKKTVPQIKFLQHLPMNTFSWVTEMMLKNKAVVCNNVDDLPDVAVIEKKEFKNEGIKSILIVPLTRGDKVVGSVGFDAVSHYVEWDDYTVELLRSFSNYIYQALDRKGTLALIEESKQLEFDMTKKLLEMQEEQLNFFIKHAPAAIAIFDCDMRYVAVSDRWIKDYRVPKKKIIGMCYYEVFGKGSDIWKKTHKLCLTGETYQSEKDIFIGPDGKKDWVKWQAYPRKDCDGNITGVIMLTEVITERIKYEEKIVRMTNYDTLTSVPNRKFFSEILVEKLGKGGKRKSFSSVLMIGLNNLQSINNYFNVFIGDQLLQEVAKRLLSVIGDVFFARLDGDQFAMIVDFSTKTKLNKMIKDIHAVINKPFKINHYQLKTSVSVGVRVLRPKDRSSSIVLRDGAIAMQHAKHLTNSDTEFFDDELESKERRGLIIENDFQKAIDDSQFHMVYQPQYSLHRKKYIGMEALIRWRHPKLKNIPPGEFILAAERTGKILPLGRWVVSTVLKEYCAFRKKMKIEDDFTVSINISPYQLLDKNFFSFFANEIDKYKIPPRLVEVEITEEKLSINPTVVTETLLKIRGLGCKVAIDDFGTGHSSLNRLKSLPITTLKIDKTFIDNIEESTINASLVKHILLLANELGMKTIAEGVERKEQLDVLKLLGCGRIQGFYYSKPISLEKVAKKCFN